MAAALCSISAACPVNDIRIHSGKMSLACLDSRAVHQSCRRGVSTPHLRYTSTTCLSPFGVAPGQATLACTASRKLLARAQANEVSEGDSVSTDTQSPSPSSSLPAPKSSASGGGKGFGSKPAVPAPKKDSGTPKPAAAAGKGAGASGPKPIVRRAAPAKPLLGSEGSEQAQQTETAIVATLGLIFAIILFEGLFLAAAGFLPEEWDTFALDNVYPAFSPTVALFLLMAAGYGLLKFLGAKTD